MATPFSYANSITAATPAVAAEVQGNFDDLLDWIDAYYQQSLDTTAEIAAAIAAAPSVVVLAAEETTAAVATGSITLGTKFEIPGLTATWTAEATHLYRIDANQYWAIDSSTTSHRHTLIASDTGAGTGGERLWTMSSGSVASGGSLMFGGGFCFLTGLTGSVTWKIYGLVQDGASHNAQTQGEGQMIVTDMGVAP